MSSAYTFNRLTRRLSGTQIKEQTEPPAGLVLPLAFTALSGCSDGMSIAPSDPIAARPVAAESQPENGESDSTTLRTIAVLLVEVAVWIGSALVGSIFLTALR